MEDYSLLTNATCRKIMKNNVSLVMVFYSNFFHVTLFIDIFITKLKILLKLMNKIF